MDYPTFIGDLIFITLCALFVIRLLYLIVGLYRENKELDKDIEEYRRSLNERYGSIGEEEFQRDNGEAWYEDEEDEEFDLVEEEEEQEIEEEGTIASTTSPAESPVPQFMPTVELEATCHNCYRDQKRIFAVPPGSVIREEHACMYCNSTVSFTSQRDFDGLARLIDHARHVQAQQSIRNDFQEQAGRQGEGQQPIRPTFPGRVTNFRDDRLDALRRNYGLLPNSMVNEMLQSPRSTSPIETLREQLEHGRARERQERQYKPNDDDFDLEQPNIKIEGPMNREFDNLPDSVKEKIRKAWTPASVSISSIVKQQHPDPYGEVRDLLVRAFAEQLVKRERFKEIKKQTTADIETISYEAYVFNQEEWLRILIDTFYAGFDYAQEKNKNSEK